MACMEHECCECCYFWADNTTAYSCPKCGGRVTNSYDDADVSDYDNYRDDRDEWDDDDREDFWEDIGRP